MRSYLILWLKGVAMGAADVVPGVSGGTVAFITGIYEELIDSLRGLTPSALGVWRREGILAFWRRINGSFLLTLFAGVLFSLFTLANAVTYLLEHHALLVWGFFFGLILASVLYVARQLVWRSPGVWVALLVGVAIALVISQLRPAQLPGEWWMVFIAGMIAICAMILPGISGSFLLLMMGMYPVFLAALSSFDVAILASFFGGCVVGLLAFSHLLSWLLHHYHARTLALLTGILLGSLTIIWPWKQMVTAGLDHRGEPQALVQVNVWPGNYPGESLWPAVLALAVLGFFLVLAVEWGAAKGRPKAGTEPRTPH
ncbi:DUF368 domain-containing protein [Marinimicrobium alkaliphilum]|uniref:DUF368 domain-containing protein n=1 Tax=Marinimicrobium alkaliphilum TaxID=2202654 RepID=UPI001E4D0623|nr:DUF368 domain-containing protein [Marinimicrobium alkaliphilum]